MDKMFADYDMFIRSGMGSLLIEEFLIDLIKGIDLDEQAIKKIAEELQVKVKDRNTCCIVFSVDDFEGIKQDHRKNAGFIKSHIVNILKGSSLNKEELELIDYKDNLYVILTSDSREVGGYRILERNEALMAGLRNSLFNQLNIQVSFGISDLAMGYRSTSSSFNNALMALSQKYIKYRRHTFYYRDLLCCNNLSNLSTCLNNIKKQMITHVKSGNYDEAAVRFQEFIDEIKKFDYIDIRKLKLFLERLHNLIFSDFSEIYPAPFAEDSCNSDNIDETGKVFTNSLKMLSKTRYGWVSANYLVKEAICYIHDNYTKSLSLIEISEHLCVSVSYICRIFNRELKTTINDYILSLRIEKAKNLLRDYNVKNYEIAEMVGFKSNVHYNIVFKKLTGMTPTEYRNKKPCNLYEGCHI